MIIFNSKVFKLQRDSSVTLNTGQKSPISAKKLKITSTKIQILPWNFFPWVIWSKQNETYMLSKVFYEKSAQIDVSKEICIPISKGLKHLNAVLCQSLLLHELYALLWIIQWGRNCNKVVNQLHEFKCNQLVHYRLCLCETAWTQSCKKKTVRRLK